MATSDELLENLMRTCKQPADLIGTNGLLQQLAKLSRSYPAQSTSSTAEADTTGEKRG
jgi:hypothetical protein